MRARNAVAVVLLFASCARGPGAAGDTPERTQGSGGRPSQPGTGKDRPSGTSGADADADDDTGSKAGAKGRDDGDGAGGDGAGGAQTGGAGNSSDGLGGGSGTSSTGGCTPHSEFRTTVGALAGVRTGAHWVFDAEGGFVGIDEENHLVRISSTGKRRDLGRYRSVMGMDLLPDGSLLTAVSASGPVPDRIALERVFADGEVRVVFEEALDHVDSLTVGPDGFVYLPEERWGRVRRINPDTGQFTLAAVGLDGPTRVAFGADPTTMYVGASDSGIYRVNLTDPDGPGEVTVLAGLNHSKVREAMPRCADQEVGAECPNAYSQRARCLPIGNVVDCVPVDPCPDMPEGAFCTFPEIAHCNGGRCVDICREVGAGGACAPAEGTSGICEETSWGLECTPVNSCAGLEEGAPCPNGLCFATGRQLNCLPPNQCTGLPAGSSCESEKYGPGVCDSRSPSGFLLCFPAPCERLNLGDPCYDFSFEWGTCSRADDGSPFCEPPNVCDGLENKALCEDQRLSGECRYTSDGTRLVCRHIVDRCPKLEDGAICRASWGGDGYCEAGRCEEWGPIAGLGVDECGNVYATESNADRLWRVTPDGQVDRVAELPAASFGVLRWGRGKGFSRTQIYVGGADGLVAVDVGTPAGYDQTAR